jgi:hypothetical protein
MSFGQFDHFHHTFRKDPIICVHDFAVFAVRGHLTHGDIPVRIAPDKFFVVVDPDPLIFLGIGLSDFKGPIGTAVIDDAIFPILIGLRQYAFYALGEKLLAVIHRREHAHERL